MRFYSPVSTCLLIKLSFKEMERSRFVSASLLFEDKSEQKFVYEWRVFSKIMQMTSPARVGKVTFSTRGVAH